MQIINIHRFNVHLLLPEPSAGPNRTLFSPSPPFLSDSHHCLPLLVAPLSSPLSQCLFPCFFFPQLLNSPAHGQMLNQFLNASTFATEGHLTLLTSQTTSDLELNAPSQSIFCPKYKQCFNPLILKLDNCQTKQLQTKNKKRVTYFRRTRKRERCNTS